MLSYEAGNVVWYAVTNAFVFLFILYFQRLRFGFARSAAASLATLSAITLLDCVRFLIVVDSASVWFNLITLAEIALVQGTAVFLSSYRDGRALFTGMVASNYALPGYLAGALFLSFSHSHLLALCATLVVSTALLIALVRIVQKEYLLLQARGKSGWLSLCFIPALFYLLFYFLTSVPVPITDKPDDIPAAFIALATMMISYVIVMRYMEKNAADSDAGRRKALLEGYARSLSIEAAAIEETQRNLSILKHDLRHYAVMVRALLDEQDHEGTQRLLDEVTMQIDRSSAPIYSEDPALNAVLGAVALSASQQGVTLDTSVSLPEGAVGSRIEFAAVVANLLENAVQAAQAAETADRTVAVRIRPVKGQLIVEISNPYAGQVTIDWATGLPLSKRGESHGFGLLSVREFAERNEGAFDCSFEEGLFVARLLLPQHAGDAPSP